MAVKGSQIDNDKKLLKYATYDEYLDSLETPVDLFYLKNTETARCIAELGYRSTGETLDRESFHNRKNIVKNLLYPTWRPFTLDSEFANWKDPLSLELSLRERLNRLGIVSTIIFIRIRTKSLIEISGYIDFAHRLRRENWRGFFDGTTTLKPQPKDLSYYHWKMKKVTINKTDNYQPIIDIERGLIFKNLHDLKTIDLNPEREPGHHTTRLRIKDGDYEQIVLYDHIIRKRN